MDYAISSNARFFDDLLKVLDDHHGEAGVAEAIEGLKAAKFNYAQRSMDHMLRGLVLAVHSLTVNQLSERLRREIFEIFEAYYRYAMSAGSRMTEIARQYERQGGPLLSPDQVLKEVDERRGTSR
jgi:hypothetical protein